MIKCEKGKGVYIRGDTLQVIEEFVNIIKGVKTSCEMMYDSETADVIITCAGQLAYEKEDDLKDEFKEVLEKLREEGEEF